MAKICNTCGASCEDSFSNCPYCGNSFNNQQQNSQFNQNNQYQQSYGQYNNGQYNQYNQQYNQYGPQVECKSKMAAGLLAIFLGSLGVHNFYLGYTGKAVAQLLLTVLTCGFGATISGIWGLIEGIMILCGNIKTDAQGIPLQD